MRILTIDQSMASCAYVVLEDETPIFKEVLHTTGSDKPKDWQVKFDNPVEQMDYISKKILGVANSFDVEHVVMESLSFGSAGNATRDLAGLFFCIQLTLFRDGNYGMDQLHTIAPTSAKSWAWNFLPEDMQSVPNEKGTKMNKRKMGKDEMVIVANRLYPGFLDGYNKTGKSGGLTDLADAILIGRAWRAKRGL